MNMVKNEGKKLTCGMENNMVTKGYMEHMKRVNKGLEYMYPNRGKGSNRKNLPENPIVSHIYPIIKKVRKKVELW